MQGARAMPQVNFRIPQELKDWLVFRARTNFRSANAELIACLEDVRQKENALTAATVRALVQ